MTKIELRYILKALRTVRAPGDESDLVTSGRVEENAIRITGEDISFVISVPANTPPEDCESLRNRAEKVVAALPGVTSVRTLLTSETSGSTPSGPSRVAGHVIAVASGKGGVGKSTVAVNLAVSLAAQGLTVGILDADIYGPSLPLLLGISDFRPARTNGRIEPARAFGLRAMSIGFMLSENGPVIWRGPMVQSAILQMLRETDWGNPDILLIDMPPGTGDAQIAIAQRAGLSGAVIVSTPQDVALSDARKGLETFQKLDVPIIGIVENMSVFICPCCNAHTPVFGQGGAGREAERLGVPFLGALPILQDICSLSDAGTPIVAAHPDSPATRAFADIARKIQTFCSLETKNPSIPPRATS